MNQIIDIARTARRVAHADRNKAASLAAVALARQLAAQGLSILEIDEAVFATGYKMPDGEVNKIWSDYQDHLQKFGAALRAGA